MKELLRMFAAFFKIGLFTFGGGLANADSWAGADKPETIQRLYDESSRWLFEKE